MCVHSLRVDIHMYIYIHINVFYLFTGHVIYFLLLIWLYVLGIQFPLDLFMDPFPIFCVCVCGWVGACAHAIHVSTVHGENDGLGASMSGIIQASTSGSMSLCHPLISFAN